MTYLSPEEGGKPVVIDLVPEHGGSLAHTNLMKQVLHSAMDLSQLAGQRQLTARDVTPIYSAETIEKLKFQADAMTQAVAEHRGFVKELVARRTVFDSAIDTIGLHALGALAEVRWLPDILFAHDIREVRVITDGELKATVPSIGQTNDLDFYVRNVAETGQHPQYSFRRFSITPVLSGQ